MSKVFDVSVPVEIRNPESRVGYWKKVAVFKTRREAEDYLWMAWGLLPEDVRPFISEREAEEAVM